MQRGSASANIEIVPMSPVQLDAVREQLIDVYGRTFTHPPYNEQVASRRGFARSLSTYLARPDFRCFVARDGEIVGFAFGYTCGRGQWWYDTVTRRLPPHVVERWFTHAFEVVDLAVLPEYQGMGIGGRLHDALLTGLPHKTAVLSALQGETAAQHLYRGRGWHTLVSNFRFPGIDLVYQLMGLSLPS